MNPLVEAAYVGGAAAIVSGGWTALVAIVGSRSTKAATRQAIEANTADTIRALEAARKDHVWDKQAATYVDAIVGIRYQQRKRRAHVGTTIVGEPPEVSDPPSNLREVEARLLAYASPKVIQAFTATNDAWEKAQHLYEEWQAAGNPEGGVVTPREELRQALRLASRDADEKEDVLIETIRVDLLGEEGKALRLLMPRPKAPAQPDPEPNLPS
jgi:hypothetical protein